MAENLEYKFQNADEQSSLVRLLQDAKIETYGDIVKVGGIYRTISPEYMVLNKASAKILFSLLAHTSWVFPNGRNCKREVDPHFKELDSRLKDFLDDKTETCYVTKISFL